MRTSTMLRWGALAALLAALAPAPASAQLGGFLKKKLKQTIRQTLAADTTAGTPSAAAPGGSPGAPASGPAFNAYVLEMTPAVLDQLARGLAAEAAEQKAVANQLASILSKPAHEQCIQKLLATPEGQKAYDAMTNGQSQQGSADMQKLMEARCGPDPNTRETIRLKLANRPAQAGEAASGFKSRQYEILKERVAPFCALTAPAAGPVRIPAGSSGLFLVYSPAEVQALSARCASLLPALKAVS